MKKGLFLLLVPAYMLLVANVGCHGKHMSKQPVDVYFWKNKQPETVHHLYIDDSLKAVIPYLPGEAIKAGGDSVKKQGVLLRLIPGEYDVEAKDDDNNVLCAGTLTISIREGSNNIGSSWQNGNCAVHVVLK